MDKPFPALCAECNHSRKQKGSEWNLLCVHPIVNAKDPWALARSGVSESGSGCRDERARRWFAPCGMSGKLWDRTTPN
jgi:hypothetical protein